MRELCIHLWHFIVRVLDFSISLGGTSRAGFFFLLLVPPIWSAFKDTEESVAKGATWREAMTRLKLMSALKKPVVIIWIGLLVWSLGSIAYKDHEGLVQKVKVDDQNILDISHARDSWKAKAESPTPGPTKIISKNVPTEPEKRCWLSNVAGMANSKIAGAVTANEAIIRCNYRIEAPYEVKLQFDRDFIPGAVLPIDSGSWSFGPTNTDGTVLTSRIESPSLPANQIVVVTVYGRTDQYPKALKGLIQTVQ